MGQGPRRTEAVRGGALGSGSGPGGLHAGAVGGAIHAVPVGGGELLRSRGVTSSGPSTKGSASVTSWSQKENSFKGRIRPRGEEWVAGQRGQRAGRPGPIQAPVNWQGGHSQRWDKRGWDPPTPPSPCRGAVGSVARALPEGLTSLGGPEGTGSKLINSPGSSAGQMAWGDAAVMGVGQSRCGHCGTHWGAGAFGGGTRMCAERGGAVPEGKQPRTGEGLGI